MLFLHFHLLERLEQSQPALTRPASVLFNDIYRAVRRFRVLRHPGTATKTNYDYYSSMLWKVVPRLTFDGINWDADNVAQAQ